MKWSEEDFFGRIVPRTSLIVDTPLVQQQLSGLAAMHDLAESEVLEQVFLANVPQRRMLEPGEIAAMARFLVSEEARGITGQAINVSAGWITH